MIKETDKTKSFILTVKTNYGFNGNCYNNKSIKSYKTTREVCENLYLITRFAGYSKPLSKPELSNLSNQELINEFEKCILWLNSEDGSMSWGFYISLTSEVLTMEDINDAIGYSKVD